MKRIFFLLFVVCTLVAEGQHIYDTPTLRSRINTQIVTNGTKAITAAQLNYILNGVMNTWPKSTLNATAPLSWNANTRTLSLPGWNANNWNTVYNWYATNPLNNYVPASRTITINGVTLDLSQNRSWTINTGSSSLILTGDVLGAGSGTISTMIVQGAITNDKLADKAVTLSKWADVPRGYIVGRPWDSLGTGRPTFLLIGSGLEALGQTLYVKENFTNQKVQAWRNGTLVGTRKTLNFIEGTGITLGMVDNAGQDRIDITVNSTVNSGPPDTSYLQNLGNGDTLLLGVDANTLGIKSIRMYNGNGISLSNITEPGNDSTVDYVGDLANLTQNTFINGNAKSYSLTNTSSHTIATNGALDVGGTVSLIRGAFTTPTYYTAAELSSAETHNFPVASSGSPVTVVRVTSLGHFAITGLDVQSTTATQMGRIVFFHNVGGTDITFKDQNSGSSAVNRFDLAEDYLLRASEAVAVQYDGVAERWRILGRGGTSGVNNGSANQTGGITTSEGPLYTRTGTNKDTLNITLTEWKATYGRIEIQFDVLRPTNDGVAFQMSLSADGTTFPYTGHVYSYNTESGNGSGAQNGNILFTGTGAAADENTTGSVIITNFQETLYKPSVRYEFDVREYFNGLPVPINGRLSTTLAQDVDAVQFRFDAGNIANFRIRVIGYKN